MLNNFDTQSAPTKRNIVNLQKTTTILCSLCWRCTVNSAIGLQIWLEKLLFALSG